MAIELALAIKAVSAVSSLIKSSTDAAKTIHSGWRARNEDAREKIEEHLAELGQSMKHAAELARAAEAYSRTNEEIVVLLQACRRTEDFLQEKRDELSSRSKKDYDWGWRLADALFDSVRRSQSVPRKVVLDRADWYDSEDKHQIDLLLNQVNELFVKASASVQRQLAADAEREMGEMISRLEDVELLLRTTVYDKILGALGRMA